LLHEYVFSQKRKLGGFSLITYKCPPKTRYKNTNRKIMKPKYQPISCHFYDELELLAMRQKKCSILYLDANDQQQEITDTILTFKIIDKAEYVILKNNDPIRLDRLIQVDGKVLKGFC